MNIKLIEIKEEHRRLVVDMMNTFYHSPAVSSDGSVEIYNKNVDACIDASMPLKGYLIADPEKDDAIAGYTMIAGGYSTEFAKEILWVEDIYLLEQYRNRGLGSSLLDVISEMNPQAICKLEVEDDNAPAKHTYTKKGYRVLPYEVMIRMA